MKSTYDCYDRDGWSKRGAVGEIDRARWYEAKTFAEAAEKDAEYLVKTCYYAVPLDVYVRDRHGEARKYTFTTVATVKVELLSSCHVEGPLCAR